MPRLPVIFEQEIGVDDYACHICGVPLLEVEEEFASLCVCSEECLQEKEAIDASCIEAEGE
jgi:hypothetical protein